MKRRVAIYARVSTEHEEQLSSLENQVQYYDNIMKSHEDWELYDRYIDEGITGTSIKKRKNFMRMLDDAEHKKFDLIITREVSRFARNTVDTLQKTRELKKLGVEVWFIDDNIWTFKDEDGELKLTIMATLAQNESKKTSQRVKSGQQITFQNGVFYGTGNILGYDRIGKDMVINEKQSKVVKLIFDLFLQGLGTQKIKYELESRGIPTATGLKTWNASQIGRILKNPFYCGTIVYRKSYIPDYLEQKPKKNNGEVEKVIVEGRHEPIVTKEEFEKVQKILDSHSIKIDDNSSRRAGIPTSIWSTKLKCSCGANMNKKVYSKNKDSIMYGYICYDQKNYGSAKKREQKGMDTEGFCDIPVVQEWKLDLMAHHIFKRILKDKNTIRKMAFEIIDSTIGDPNVNINTSREITLLENKLVENKTRLGNLLDALINGLLDKEMYVNKKNEIDNDNDVTKMKLSELKAIELPTKEEVESRINVLKKNFDDTFNFDINNITDELIDTFVERITVFKDHFDWKLKSLSNYSNEEKKDIQLARIVITPEDVSIYNEKHKMLRRVCQKDNIFVDVYI